MTQEELIPKIQAAACSQVSDVKSTAERVTAQAEDGEPVTLVLHRSGQIKERN
jgi:hypothetical protein